ncbi:MAG: glutathione S-transferase family protein [Pseudomonadota bacterium]
MIKIWGRQSSSNVQAVLWCLSELKLPFERIDAGYIYGVVDTEAYRAMNPNCTIPTLIDGDGPPLWESAAIMRYLANRYGADPFWPSDPIDRAHVDKWAEWSKLNIAVKFTAPIFWGLVRTAPSKRNYDAIEKSIGVLENNLDIAERQLDRGPYLAGDAFTLADILFGHCLYRYFDLEMMRPERENLTSYYARLRERPAFKDHVMVSYEELRITE